MGDGVLRIIKSEECVPIGHAVNANVAMVTGFSCHEDREEARRRGPRASSSSATRSATTTSSATTSRA